MQFRAAGPDDIAGISALWHEGWHAAHAAVVPAALTALRTLESFTARTTAKLDAMQVVEDNSTRLGFFLLHDNELDQFYVAAQARGQGVAQQLIAQAEVTITAKGYDLAWLACSVGNDRAARFYEKSGWVRVGTKRMEFETSGAPFPLDIWRYEKALKTSR